MKMTTNEQKDAELEHVSRDAITIGPFNPRKRFPKQSLEELADSIRSHGILSPLLVRPTKRADHLPGVDDAFELVAGERRFRASEIAGLDRIPVLIRELTDCEVREIQLIENLQREDVSAFDEATGYAELLELKGEDGESLYNIDKIAEAIGQNREYVTQRLRVRKTPRALLEALDEGRVGVKVCESVGRIPAAEDREKIVEEILEPMFKDTPLSLRETLDLIASDYMVDLRRAQFDRNDPELVPEAGTCEACPYRSGNCEDIQSELQSGPKRGISPHICTSPACFRSKSEAAWRALSGEEDVEVLPDQEAEKEFTERGLRYGSKIVDLNAPPSYEQSGQFDIKKTWKQLAKGADLPTRKARNPHTGEILEVADLKLAKEAVNLAAEKRGSSSPFKKSTSEEDKERRRKELEKSKRERMEVATGLDLVSAAMKDAGSLSRDVLLIVLESVLDENAEAARTVGKWLDLKPENGWQYPREVIPVVIETLEEADELSILILIACGSVAANLSWGGIATKHFARLLEAVGVEKSHVEKTASLRLRELAKAKKATAEKKPAAKKRPDQDPPAEEPELVKNARAKSRNPKVSEASEWFDSQPGGTVTLRNAADKFEIEYQALRNFRANAQRKGAK